MSTDSSDRSRHSRTLLSVPASEEFRFWADDNAPLRRRLFGRESVSRLWTASALELFRLSSLESSGLDTLGVHAVSRNEDGDLFCVEISIRGDDPCGYWLQFQDDGGELHGIVLPTERRQALRYHVECRVVETNQDELRLERLGGFIIHQSAGPLSEAIAAWELCHRCDLDGASAAVQALAADGHIGSSPLTAVLAALVVLRVNRADLLKDTLLELARQFPAQPDLPVLMIEQLLRSRHDALHVAAQILTACLDQALPHTGEGLSYAQALVHRMLTSRKLLAARLVTSLQRQQTRIDATLPYLRPGGLLVALCGYSIGEAPWQVLGVQKINPANPVADCHGPPFPSHTSLSAVTESPAMPPRELPPIWQYIEANIQAIRDSRRSPDFPKVAESLGAALFPWFVRKGLSQLDAEERSWDTIENIFLRIDRFEWRGNGSFRAWCARLAANVRADWLRSLMRFNARPVDGEQLDRLADQHFSTEFVDMDPDGPVQLAFSRLSDNERQIIELQIFRGWSHKEIGDELGISEDTSRQQAKRAKDKLKSYLRPVFSFEEEED